MPIIGGVANRFLIFNQLIMKYIQLTPIEANALVNMLESDPKGEGIGSRKELRQFDKAIEILEDYYKEYEKKSKAIGDLYRKKIRDIRNSDSSKDEQDIDLQIIAEKRNKEFDDLEKKYEKAKVVEIEDADFDVIWKVFDNFKHYRKDKSGRKMMMKVVEAMEDAKEGKHCPKKGKNKKEKK